MWTMYQLNLNNPTLCIMSIKRRLSQLHLGCCLSTPPRAPYYPQFTERGATDEAGGEDKEDDLGCQGEKETPSEARDTRDNSMKRTFMYCCGAPWVDKCLEAGIFENSASGRYGEILKPVPDLMGSAKYYQVSFCFWVSFSSYMMKSRRIIFLLSEVISISVLNICIERSFCTH